MEPIVEHPSEQKMNELIEIVRQRVLETEFPLARRTDGPFIAKFVRCKRYDVDKAVIAYNKYYKNLQENMRLVEGLYPQKFTDAYNMDAVHLLKHNFNGARILHARVSHWNTSIASLRDVEHSAAFIVEEIFQDSNLQLNGAIGIIDVSGLSFSQIRQATISEIRFAIRVGLQMFPIKVAGLHVLNASALFWPIYKIGVQFLPQKIRDRIFFHSSVNDLAKALSPDILPKFLGGNIEDQEALDTEFIPKLVERNLPYDWYWNGAMERPYRPRRLDRKRSSMKMMCS